MAIAGVSANGIMSGLDVGGLVSQILEIEQRPITLLSLRQNDYELKISSLLSLSEKLSAYKSALEELNDAEKFNTKSASVSTTSGGTELMTVSTTSEAIAGSYSVQVKQLAKSSKKASQGWVDSNSTAIASSAANFKFKVGSSGAETNISVSNTTTLQELADAINTTDSGVTASIINDGTGSNSYRLILTSDETGSPNEVIVVTNTTNLDFTNKQVEAAYADTLNTYSGTVASNEGNNYTGTTNKTFMMEIVTSDTPGSGNAEYKYSIDGGINWLGDGGAAYDGTNGIAVAADDTLQNIDGLDDSSTTTEGAKVKFTDGTLAVGDKFTIDVFNPEMQEPLDAVITVDNATIVKGSNTISDAIAGVTMNLLEADTSSTVTVTVSSSSSEAKEGIESFVEAYNGLFEFINEQLSYDPEDGQANPLLGDPTLLEIRRKIADAVTSAIPGITGSTYKSMSQIGITSDYKTGELEIDQSQLVKALSDDPVAVSMLFAGAATPSNQSITFESKTSKTQAGSYGVSISTAPEKATLTGDNDLSSTGLGSEETLIFKYSENYSDDDTTFTAFSATLTAGSTINTIVTTLNSTFATNNAKLAASNDGGKLKITSTEYGEDFWFQVTTDSEGASQVWNDDDADPTLGMRSDGGVDIKGSINGHVATGEGNILTAGNGFPEEGLQISTTSSQTGLFGTVSVSLGIADLLPSIIESYIDADTGILKSKEASMQDSIDSIEDRIQLLEQRIATKEEMLLAQFSRLEVLLAQYDAVSQYLTNTFTAIQNMNSK